MLDILLDSNFILGLMAGVLIGATAVICLLLAFGLVNGAILGGLFVAAHEESARNALNAQRDRLRGGSRPSAANDETHVNARRELRRAPR